MQRIFMESGAGVPSLQESIRSTSEK
jgi:hypothetical protein